MIRRPPRSTRTDTLFPDTTLFRSVRLIKGSHIVVPRLFEGAHAYIFQSADRRVVFAIPYEADFTLIGTTDVDYSGDPRSEEHTSELQSLMRISYAVFCLKKQTHRQTDILIEPLILTHASTIM